MAWDYFAVIQGAGGMLMIDPLFQRVLVSECRSRNIPVIFDEVFTGFWRLGTEVGIPCISFSFVLLLFFLLSMLLSFNIIEVLNYLHFIYFLESVLTVPPFTVCSRTTWLSTWYSLLCKADDWRGYTLGCNIGLRCSFWFFSWRIKGDV